MAIVGVGNKSAQVDSGGLVSATKKGLVETLNNDPLIAVSVRKISENYTGSCVRIRRSSDNAEKDFGFDTNGLLDWRSAYEWAGAEVAYIKKWYDQSGNGWDLISPGDTYDKVIDFESIAKVEYPEIGDPSNTRASQLTTSGLSGVSDPDIFYCGRWSNNYSSGTERIFRWSGTLNFHYINSSPDPSQIVLRKDDTSISISSDNFSEFDDIVSELRHEGEYIEMNINQYSSNGNDPDAVSYGDFQIGRGDGSEEVPAVFREIILFDFNVSRPKADFIRNKQKENHELSVTL